MTSNKKLTLQEVVERARAVHGDSYDYSNAVYVSYNDPIEVVCKVTRKSFYPSPANHINLRTRCPCCFGAIKGTSESFKEKARKVWGDVFDYSNVVYTNNTGKVIIFCKKHGLHFTQSPKNHLLGQNGCAACTNKIPITTAKFVEMARAVHGGAYDYSKSVYIGTDKKLSISCKIKFAMSESIHGDFEQTPHNHISLGQGCPVCGKARSRPEVDITKILGNHTFQSRARILPSGREVDIYLPNLKLAIEYNGLYWHSEGKRDKYYHAEKTLECQKLGIRLIQIFEDEWIEKSEIVKNRIQSFIGMDTRTYARNTVVRSLKWNQVSEFLDSTHIQGHGSPTPYNIGLFNKKEELVAAMTFSNLRFENTKEGVFELVRYSSKGTIVGGFSKLLKCFIRLQSPHKIISYSDRRWSQGNVYITNGFKFVSTTAPGYFWAKDKKRFSRVNFQKHKLKNIFANFDESLTEEQNCILNGYVRIWDCGHDKWELTL